MSERINGYKVSIYKEGSGWTGVLDLGFHPDGRRNRPKRKGPSKTAVRDKLIKLANALDGDVKTETAYTVARCVADFIAAQRKAGKAARTIKIYESYASVHVAKIGAVKITDLTADMVDSWLTRVAKDLATGTVKAVHALLTRSLGRAMRYSKVGRNVSAVVDTPKGGASRDKRQSFTVAQMAAIMTEAMKPVHRLGAYVILGLTTGMRPEELRAVRWADIDLDNGVVYVITSTRESGDVKTETSRRGLALIPRTVDALRAHKVRQARELLALGIAQDDQTTVFTREDGRTFTAESALYYFRKLLKTVEGIDASRWVPYSMRHTFCSVLSHADRDIREIADLMGHASTSTTQATYRHNLKPVMNGAAAVMGTVFDVA